MRVQNRAAFAAFAGALLTLTACGGGSDTEGAESGGSEISGAPTPISAEASCDLLTAADFGAALNGELVVRPDSGEFVSGCSWSDDDGKLIELSVTTFDSADDLDDYELLLQTETTVAVAGYDIVATNVGDFVAVGLADRYQVVGLFTADDVPDELATTVVTRWREASN